MDVLRTARGRLIILALFAVLGACWAVGAAWWTFGMYWGLPHAIRDGLRFHEGDISGVVRAEPWEPRQVAGGEQREIVFAAHGCQVTALEFRQDEVVWGVSPRYRATAVRLPTSVHLMTVAMGVGGLVLLWRFVVFWRRCRRIVGPVNVDE